jgi:hypothetical protein
MVSVLGEAGIVAVQAQRAIRNGTIPNRGRNAFSLGYSTVR